jgi:parvulin-like peptidyl-prolyl isomerase
VLLALGALAGLVAAAIGLMQSGTQGDGLPDYAAAAVNGEILRLHEYQRAVEALASDRREPLGDAERRHVLDRMIEEELLVQRGLELGLARHDRRVRGDIVSAVIQAVVAQTEGYEPTGDELESFFEENRDYFARTGRVFVQQVWVRGAPHRSDEQARARAADVAARLRAGEPFEAVEDAFGDPQVAPVPRDYLPVAKLREYLGPSATRVAIALEPGGVSDPVKSGSGWHVILLVDREVAVTPPLSEVRTEVAAELVRRKGDEALRSYLDDLRERADVRAIDPAS